MNRPETIEETADARGRGRAGAGIAVQVDHLVPEQVSALVARIEAEQGALHVLVNDIWGATTMEWNKTVWESSLEVGLRTLRLAVDTHAITSHFALPLLIKTPGGLVVEVTDGTAEYNATNYRVSFFYDLAKAANLRMAFALAHELQPHGATAVALTPGWLRSEAMLEAYGVTESNWRDATSGRPTSRSPRARLRRPRRGGAGAGSRRRALERTVAVQRAAGQGLWLHRRRRQPARCLAVHRRGAGRRQARRHDRLSLTRRSEVSTAGEHRLDVHDRRAVDGFDGADPQPGPSILRTVTRCRPSGFGRSGERVAKTPASGRRPVGARMDFQHVAPGSVEPGEDDDLVAHGQTE